SERRTELIALEREHRARSERIVAIQQECDRARARAAGAEQQIAALEDRFAQAEGELARLAALPAIADQQRQKLADRLVEAEEERRIAADRPATADSIHRQAAQDLRAAQAAVADEREARARIEAQLDNARARRSEDMRRIRDQMGCAADQCLALAEVTEEDELPTLQDADHRAAKLRSERERLGGVNLQAE